MNPKNLENYRGLKFPDPDTPLVRTDLVAGNHEDFMEDVERMRRRFANDREVEPRNPMPTERFVLE